MMVVRLAASEHLRHGSLIAGWFSILAIVLIGGGLLFVLRRERRNVVEFDAQMRAQKAAFVDYLLESGIPATATVLYVDTGSTERDVRRSMNGMLPPALSFWPLLIGLRVHITDYEPYNIEIRQHVDPEDLAALQPGATVEILVDPADPNQAMIDFTEPVVPPGAV
jgi:hypothetical protein